MIHLLQAGIYAAAIQSFIVLWVSIAALYFLGPEQLSLTISARGANFLISHNLALLICADILIALCVVTFRSQYVIANAIKLIDGCRRMYPNNPVYIATTALAYFGLATLAFALLDMRPPPIYVLDLGLMMGSIRYAAVIWSAIMSIGIAAFGANAHAAALAKSALIR